jgi:hypothetical protein
MRRNKPLSHFARSLLYRTTDKTSSQSLEHRLFQSLESLSSFSNLQKPYFIGHKKHKNSQKNQPPFLTAKERKERKNLLACFLKLIG